MNSVTTAACYGTGNQILAGDFDVEFTGIGNTSTNNFSVGVVNPGSSTILYGWNITATVCYAVDNGVQVGSNHGAQTALTTRYRVKRVGTLITYFINDVLKYTSTVPLGSAIMVVLEKFNSGVANAVLGNAKVVANTGQYHGVILGTAVNQTGLYDPLWYQIDFTDVNLVMLDMKIDNVNVAAKYGINAGSPVTTPAANELTVTNTLAFVLCNAVDVGKTLTGKYTYLQQPLT